MTVQDLAKGPALGDWLDRMRTRRKVLLWIGVGLAVAFLGIAFFAPLVGLLLLAILLMVGVALLLYSRREVHGYGRLAPHRGRSR